MLTYQLIPLSNPFQPLVLPAKVQKMGQSVLLVILWLTGSDHPEPSKGDQAVKEQKGIAQVESKQFYHKETEQPGHQGRKDGHHRDHLSLTLCLVNRPKAYNPNRGP